MTKNTKGKKVPTKREKAKYPALNRRLNLKGRQDYIEPEYVDGVVDAKGRQVIRPLNDAEKEWLNQFYEESVVGNIWHDKVLKSLKKRRDELIDQIDNEDMKVLRSLKRQIRKEQKQDIVDEQKVEELEEILMLTLEQYQDRSEEFVELAKVNKKIRKRQKEVLLFKTEAEHSDINDANNTRNRCLFNQKNKKGMLLDLDAYPDVFMAEGMFLNDPETELIKLQEEQEAKKNKKLRKNSKGN